MTWLMIHFAGCKAQIVDFLFHVIGITPKSRVKFVHSKGISLSSLLLTILRW